MTYQILTDDTQKVIHCSNIHSALDSNSANLKVDLLNGEMDIDKPANTDIVKSVNEIDKTPLKIIDPEELIGKTFLMDEKEDGQKLRERIVRAIQDYDYNMKQDPAHIHFLCSVNDDEYKEAVVYIDILQYIEKDSENEETVWKFK